MKLAIEQYQGAKREHQVCKQWAEMIGKPYFGGGGGIGALRSFSIPCGDTLPTIYYQEHHGSTNYHKMPASLIPHLEAVIIANFNWLLSDALLRQAQSLKAIGQEAIKQHEALLKEAMQDYMEKIN